MIAATDAKSFEFIIFRGKRLLRIDWQKRLLIEAKTIDKLR